LKYNLHDKYSRTHQTLHVTLNDKLSDHASRRETAKHRAQAPQERHSSGSGVGAAAAASFAVFALSDP